MPSWILLYPLVDDVGIMVASEFARLRALYRSSLASISGLLCVPSYCAERLALSSSDFLHRLSRFSLAMSLEKFI